MSTTPYSDAIAALATFGAGITWPSINGVSGIKNSYGISPTSPPDRITPGQLPAMLIDPGPQAPLDAQPEAMMGNAQIVRFTVDQWCLLVPDDATLTIRRGMPLVLAFVDGFIQQYKALPYLIALTAGSAPPVHSSSYSAKIQTLQWGDLKAYGFIITWKLTYNL